MIDALVPLVRPLCEDEPAGLARLYLPTLDRLLDVSREFDVLLDSRSSFRSWKKSLISCVRVLEEEKSALSLIDANVKIAFQARGGQRGVIKEAKARHDARVSEAHTLENCRRYVTRRMVRVALSRYWVYGGELASMGPLYDVTEDEIATVERHFKRPGHGQTSLESERSGVPQTATTSQVVFESPAPCLSQILAEPQHDVLELQHALEGINSEMLQMHRRLQHERQTTGNAARVKAALALESRRAKLVCRCVAGIVRCFGGQQRLTMEKEWQQMSQPQTIGDAEFEALVDRLTNKALELERATRDA